MLKETEEELFQREVITGKEFAKIEKSKNICEKKGYQVLFAGDDDRQLAVFRYKGELYALQNICPHRHADQIYNAIINPEATLTCPLHGWTYNLATGDNTNHKMGLRRLVKYEIFEKEEEVWVEVPPLELPKWRSAE